MQGSEIGERTQIKVKQKLKKKLGKYFFLLLLSNLCDKF